MMQSVPTRSLLALILGSALLALSAGCGTFGGPDRSPVEADSIYDGPPARVEAMQGRHIAVFSAPTSGWNASFESTDAAYRQRHVFITLQKPDPSRMVAQHIVEHRVDTTVRRDEAVTVFARIVEQNGDPELSVYRPAVSAQGER